MTPFGQKGHTPPKGQLSSLYLHTRLGLLNLHLGQYTNGTSARRPRGYLAPNRFKYHAWVAPAASTKLTALCLFGLLWGSKGVGFGQLCIDALNQYLHRAS